MRWTMVWIVAAMGVLSIDGCKQSPDESSAQSKEIVIGEYGSMSGSEATFGQSTHAGIMLAVDDANNSGGVLGKKIKIISEDDRGNQDEAVSVVKKLINRDHAAAVLGEVASTNSLAVLAKLVRSSSDAWPSKPLKLLMFPTAVQVVGVAVPPLV